jgi:oxidoreductase
MSVSGQYPHVVVSLFWLRAEFQPSGKSALVLGGTGQVGRHVLREVLCSTHFTRVCEAGRRLTPLESLPEHVHAKLDQRKVDFENASDWQDAFRDAKFDVVFIA